METIRQGLRMLCAFCVGVFFCFSFIYFFGDSTLLKINTNFWEWSLGIASMLATLLIYEMGYKQADEVENSTKIIQKIAENLQTHISGQANGFDEVFPHMYNILNDASKKKYALMAALPVVTFGNIKIGNKPDFDKYWGDIRKFIEQDNKTVILSMNPFTLNWNSETNPVQKYFLQIATLIGIKEYKNNFQENLCDYYVGLKELIEANQKSNSKQLEMLFINDDKFINFFYTNPDSEYKGNESPKTLMFFVNYILKQIPTTSKSLNSTNEVNDVTTGFYSITPNISKLANTVFKQQAQTAFRILKKLDPNDLICLINEIIKQLKEKKYANNTTIFSLIEENNKIISERKYKVISFEQNQETSAKIFFYDHRKTRNIIIFPSSAGLFTNHTDRLKKIKDEYRFNLYNRIIESLSDEYNIYLVSFSGQNLDKLYNETGLKYDYFQMQKDVKKIFEMTISQGIQINGAIGICTGSMAICNYLTDNNIKNIPLFIWDAPALVHWKQSDWFTTKFPEILIDDEGFKKTEEPHLIIEKFITGGKIFYGYCKNNRNQDINDYKILIDFFNGKSKEYLDIGHIPNPKQNSSVYEEFINDIKTFF